MPCRVGYTEVVARFGNAWRHRFYVVLFGIMSATVRAKLRNVAILVGIALVVLFCIWTGPMHVQLPNGTLDSWAVARNATRADIAVTAMPFSVMRTVGRKVFVEDTPPPSPETLRVAQVRIPPRRDAAARVAAPVLVKARVPRSNRQRAP